MAKPQKATTGVKNPKLKKNERNKKKGTLGIKKRP